MGRGKFSRPTRPRNIGKKIVIICEGSTEEIYFESIRKHKRLPTVKIKVVNPDCSDPLSIVKKAVEIRDYSEREKAWLDDDQIWVVYDGDEHILNNEENWKTAIELASTENIVLGISNPSFELWFLLHYQEQNANIRRDVALSNLKKHLPHYTKTTELFPEPLEAVTSTATERAERLKDRIERDGLDNYTNPSTEIYLLVKVLQNL